MPEPVTNHGGLGIEPDIPGEFCVMQFGERLDRDIDPEQVGNPARHGLRKRRRSTRAAGEIKPHVELVAAVPVMIGVLIAEHVDLRLRGRAQHRHQRQYRRDAQTADDFLVAKKQ